MTSGSDEVGRQANPPSVDDNTLFHDFFQNAPLMMGVVELLGDDILHITDNAATAAFFGCRPDDTRNRRSSELGTPPEITRMWLAHYREADRTNAPVRFEYPHPNKDGTHYLSVRVSRITPQDAVPARFAFTIEDVTEARRLAREAEEVRRLRAVEERSTEILESITDGFFTVDREWRFTYLNAQAQNLLKRPTEELLGQNMWTMYPEAKETDLYPVYHQAMDNRTTIETEVCIPPDERWFRVRAYPSESGLSVYFCDVTERHRAEATQRDNAAILRMLEEAAPDLMWMSDADGKVLYVNRYWRSFTGLSIEDVNRVGWLNLFHPDDRDLLARGWAESAQTGQVGQAECRLRRHDGEYRWVWGRAVPVMDEAGAVIRWVGVSTDLTERKELEESLRCSHEEAERERRRLRTVLDTLPVGLVIADASGKILELNGIARSIWGLDAPLLETADAYAEAYKGWWPKTGEQLQSHEWGLSRALQTGEHVVGEEVNIECRGGQRKTILNYALPIVGDEGVIDGGVAVNVDITNRKAMEEALRHNEEQLRLAVEGGRLATFVYDPQRDTFLFQNNVHVLFGLPAPIQSVDDLRALVYPDDLVGYRTKFQRCLATGEDLDLEYRVFRRDGSVRWLQTIAHPYVLGGSTVVAGIHTDTTERREMEEALRTQAEALLAADRAKDEFLAMLGHELRNPLSVIGNATELLRLRTRGMDHLQETQVILQQQVKHMALMVDDLLDVSRITMGRMTLKKEPVDFTGIVRRAVESVAGSTQADGHNLTVTIPDTPIIVDGDAARLQQVVSNILHNAAKYTPAGGRIWVSIEEEDADVVLRVRDDGEGIAPSLLPHVFDLFTQSPQTLDRSQGGLGIGLTLVKRLVEMHGGRVCAQSAGPGAGSEFVVWLPSLRDSDETSRGQGEPGDERRPLRVLVVEDNALARYTLKQVLEADGHEVLAAADGPSALRLVKQCVPDVALLDIGLPCLNGYEVARQMRQDPALARTLLVAVTGYGQEKDRQETQASGIDVHLVKPLDFAVLSEVLKRVATSDAG